MFDLYIMLKWMLTFACGLFISLGFAQTGKIVGRILNADGEPDRGDSIYIINEKVLATTITDEYGEYEIANLKPAKYSLKVQKSGYRTTIMKKVPVYWDKATEVNIRVSDRGSHTTPLIYMYRIPITNACTIGILPKKR